MDKHLFYIDISKGNLAIKCSKCDGDLIEVQNGRNGVNKLTCKKCNSTLERKLHIENKTEDEEFHQITMEEYIGNSKN